MERVLVRIRAKEAYEVLDMKIRFMSDLIGDQGNRSINEVLVNAAGGRALSRVLFGPTRRRHIGN